VCSLFVFPKDSAMDKVINLRVSKCYLPSLEPYTIEGNFGLVYPECSQLAVTTTTQKKMV
jgi:hypothetical protein